MAPDIEERGIDLLTSIWHVMDSPGKAGEFRTPALPTYERYTIAAAGTDCGS
jgi:hypothetical protein